MKIPICASELQLGDVYRGREIVRVMQPRQPGWMLQISYQTGYDDTFYPDEELWVDRKIEFVEVEERIMK